MLNVTPFIMVYLNLFGIPITNYTDEETSLDNIGSDQTPSTFCHFKYTSLVIKMCDNSKYMADHTDSDPIR